MHSLIDLKKGLTAFVTCLAILMSSAISAHAAISPTSLSDIKAIKFNSDAIITSGLPTTEQFDVLKQAGVEAQMQYAHIAVDWLRPPLANVEQFFTIMDDNQAITMSPWGSLKSAWQNTRNGKP